VRSKRADRKTWKLTTEGTEEGSGHGGVEAKPTIAETKERIRTGCTRGPEIGLWGSGRNKKAEWKKGKAGPDLLAPLLF
jgi:hypothetical protein